VRLGPLLRLRCTQPCLRPRVPPILSHHGSRPSWDGRLQLRRPGAPGARQGARRAPPPPTPRAPARAPSRGMPRLRRRAEPSHTPFAAAERRPNDQLAGADGSKRAQAAAARQAAGMAAGPDNPWSSASAGRPASRQG
jgi:hypothetical protein